MENSEGKNLAAAGEQPEVSSQCTHCGQTFKAAPRPGKRVDDLPSQIRREFNSHESARFNSFGRMDCRRGFVAHFGVSRLIALNLPTPRFRKAVRPVPADKSRKCTRSIPSMPQSDNRSNARTVIVSVTLTGTMCSARIIVVFLPGCARARR